MVDVAKQGETEPVFVVELLDLLRLIGGDAEDSRPRRGVIVGAVADAAGLGRAARRIEARCKLTTTTNLPSGGFYTFLSAMRTEAKETTGPVLVDATLTTASETELRRRATEGNQSALFELNRRRAEAESWARAA